MLIYVDILYPTIISILSHCRILSYQLLVDLTEDQVRWLVLILYTK